MDNKKIAKQYLNTYFKSQYIKESDHEFKALVRILNKKDELVKNLPINNFSVDERTLPSPIDIWHKAAELNAVDFIEWCKKNGIKIAIN